MAAAAAGGVPASSTAAAREDASAPGGMAAAAGDVRPRVLLGFGRGFFFLNLPFSPPRLDSQGRRRQKRNPDGNGAAPLAYSNFEFVASERGGERREGHHTTAPCLSLTLVSSHTLLSGLCPRCSHQPLPTSSRPKKGGREILDC